MENSWEETNERTLGTSNITFLFIDFAKIHVTEKLQLNSLTTFNPVVQCVM